MAGCVVQVRQMNPLHHNKQQSKMRTHIYKWMREELEQQRFSFRCKTAIDHCCCCSANKSDLFYPLLIQ